MYEKAIEAGNSFALTQAGLTYFFARDYDASAQYFQQSADLNEGFSLKFLAIMYERGLLGKPDPAKAAELRLQAARVDPESQDPVVKFPPKPQPRRAAPRHRRVIYHYRFFGCSWVWC
jgi:hypothetical protein